MQPMGSLVNQKSDWHYFFNEFIEPVFDAVGFWKEVFGTTLSALQLMCMGQRVIAVASNCEE
jgi:hypothetical protein